MNFNLKACLWLLVKLLLIAHLSFPINLFLPLDIQDSIY